jgi:hypothetical protein
MQNLNTTMLFALLVDIQTDINYLKKLAEKLIEMNKEDEQDNDR